MRVFERKLGFCGLFVFLLLLLPPQALANNLKISNVSLEDRHSADNTVIVEFDISWDNSWRDTINFDAVWIVVKLEVNGVSQLDHAHPEDAGVDPPDTSPGSNSDLELYVDGSQYLGGAYGGDGIIIRRKSSGTGTVESKDVRVKVNYVSAGAGDTATIAATVLGIEMVWIPEAPFYAGDTSSAAAFRHYSATSDPWYVQSENTITTTSTTAGSFYYQSGGNTGEYSDGAIFNINASYPKGVEGFYVMKYEITEGQWVRFYNSLSTAEKLNRDITDSNGKNSTGVVRRNTVTTGQATSRPNRAVNYLGWPDLLAYLDWMALRPMTELEYEKMARGPLPAVSGEYAWGTATITAGVTFDISPELGYEVFTTANANAVFDSTTFSQGDDFLGADHVRGAVRSGIFAQDDTATRQGAGAGYYGVMELTGNLHERAVTVGNSDGATFYGTNGDGHLNTTSSYEGNANEFWPGMPGHGQQGVSGATGSGWRGGAWSTASTNMTVSFRDNAANTAASRNSTRGGRGVRDPTPTTLPTCGNDILEFPEQCDDNECVDCSDCKCSIVDCVCTGPGPTAN